MSATTFRNYAGPQDAAPQYELWLRATESLPYAWRSNLTNVRYQLRHADQYPGCRIYAERAGRLVGYIGTHPPFDWTDDWRVIPFGFPWTDPVDAALEDELYNRMMDATPRVYADAPPAVAYVQRFRGSWARHRAFMAARGWARRWALPLLASATTAGPAACDTLVTPVTGADLDAICALSAIDPHGGGGTTSEKLREQAAGGWLELASLWHVPGLGAFEMEVRSSWGEVRWLATHPDAEGSDGFWGALRSVGRRQGASEVYVTIEQGAEGRRAQLERHGFATTETGTYMTRDIEPDVTDGGPQ
jgi:hypothetical protein